MLGTCADVCANLMCDTTRAADELARACFRLLTLDACDLRAAQMLIHVICFAFLIVMASTAIFTPVLLYVFQLKKLGWAWEHGALFSAMIASTDAVAVSAILKKGAQPPFEPQPGQLMRCCMSADQCCSRIVTFAVLFSGSLLTI